MKKDYLIRPFELVLKEPADDCPRGSHQVSFFELVYIISGTGTQTINGNDFRYKRGNLFLLAPEDAHCFIFNTKTQLFFIRFNRAFFPAAMTSAFWQRLEQTLRNANRMPGCILNDKEQQTVIAHLMQCLLVEYKKESCYSNELVPLLVQSILTVVARNLMQNVSLAVDGRTDDKAANMIQFVQQHIYEPEKLKSSSLSKEFGVAETYIGRYFKNITGKTLNEFIMQNKLRLIEDRLKLSDLRINEIADEFGFTDKSHLNRFFQKRKGVSPSGFRKALSKRKNKKSRIGHNS